MRRLYVAVFAVFLWLPIVAAGPSPSLLGTPTLLIYPFAANGSDLSHEAGSRLAVTIATQIANLGGVDVKPAPPGVERQNYLAAAAHEGVDYYITGYLTPLGDGVSVVEQLVSVEAGIVVYSNTAQIRSYADAIGQGDVLREALIRHQTRNLGAYAAPPPPAAAPSPTPGGGNQANISRLFGRKQKRTNQPPPSVKQAGSPEPAASSPPAPLAVGAAKLAASAVSSAAPAVPAPARPAAPSALASPTPASPIPVAVVAAAPRLSGYGILGIGGSAESERRTFTSAAIRNVMLANHQRVTVASGATPNACSDSNVGTLLGGNLSTQNHTILGEPQTMATLELLAYDCAGSVVYRRTFARDSRGDWKTAIDRVVRSAVADFLREPPGGRRG